MKDRDQGRKRIVELRKKIISYDCSVFMLTEDIEAEEISRSFALQIISWVVVLTLSLKMIEERKRRKGKRFTNGELFCNQVKRDFK